TSPRVRRALAARAVEPATPRLRRPLAFRRCRCSCRRLRHDGRRGPHAEFLRPERRVRVAEEGLAPEVADAELLEVRVQDALAVTRRVEPREHRLARRAVAACSPRDVLDLDELDPGGACYHGICAADYGH